MLFEIKRETQGERETMRWKEHASESKEHEEDNEVFGFDSKILQIMEGNLTRKVLLLR